MYDLLPITLSVANIFITLFLLFYWISLSKKDKEYEKSQKSYLEEYKKTIEKANKKATKIIENTQVLSDDLKKSYEQVFVGLQSDIKKTTDEFLQSIQKNQAFELKQFTTKAITTAEESITKIVSDVTNEYSTKQKQIDKKISEQTKQALQEIQSYKEFKKTNIDEQVKLQVEHIVKEVLPKYISVTNHEELVVEAVQKAKAQGFFESV